MQVADARGTAMIEREAYFMDDLAILARSHLREQSHQKLFGHRWVEIADVERSRVVVVLEW